ncbi:Acyl-CoA N-acyltransferase [Penicillium citrinum]|uniref:Acyl-CoA N-acyltransferase n=2 Tax=Penicillium TaxID=5073 RepID=A0A9W9NLT1_PENCI|nr:Acyl-CoA N-acyltransferase [Penicillium citrinum]KAJ5222322.1 Acyl-CoA N-acyltransferase [Penicillium citrinum]KAJ5580479.1 Acyl-CoA N-acyltransferase [Penicillium hetheringtonii]
MAIEIVPLAKSDIPGAVDCVQKAFADDPYFHWVFNDPAQFNIQRNAASLAAHFEYGIRCGCPISVAKVSNVVNDQKMARDIQLSPGTIVGVGWWYSPQPASTPQTWSVWTQECLLSIRQFLNNVRFFGRGGLNIDRYWIWKQVQQDAHEALWKDPRGYYFCNMVGVSSQARGMGVGKRLMESVIERADQEGLPCYLESSKGYPNVTIYEKMGFRLVKEIECADKGDICKLYCMIRDAKTKS